MGNSFESWEIISEMLGKVMGNMGFFRKNFMDTLPQKTFDIGKQKLINLVKFA